MAKYDDDSNNTLRLFLQKQPANTSSSQKVVNLDRALAYTVVLSVLAFALTLSLLLGFFPVVMADGTIGWTDFWGALFGTILNAALPTHPFAGEAYRFVSLFHEYPFTIGWHLAIALVPAVVTGRLVWGDTAKPIEAQPHVDGNKAYRGKEALQKVAADAAAPQGEGFLKIHPDVAALPRNTWMRHVLMVGASGAGKTMILLHWLFGLRDMDAKVVMTDQKGDFSQLFGKFDENGNSVGAALINPWSAHSDVWDIGRELASADAVDVFCATMIPGDGPQRFFTDAAANILQAVIVTCQMDWGIDFGWTELSRRAGLSQPELVALFEPYIDEKSPNYNATIKTAHTLVIDPNPATMSVLMTLKNGAKLIDKLANAWPSTIPNDRRRKIALCDWVRDDYAGPKQLVLRGEPEKPLTEAYLAAMVNVLAPLILALKDSRRRTMAVVLDELCGTKRLNIMGLLDKGRSKGCMTVACFQDIDQVKLKYSQEEANIMWSVVGTRIVTRTGVGPTADTMSQWFGKRLVNKVNTSVTANGQGAAPPNETKSYHEESVPLVRPYDLTDENKMYRKGDKTQYGFSVAGWLTFGGNVYKLWWPGFAVDQLVQCADDELADWAKPITAPLAVKAVNTATAQTLDPTANAGEQRGHTPEPEEPAEPTDEEYEHERTEENARAPEVIAVIDEPGEPEPVAAKPTAKPAKAKSEDIDGSDLDDMIEEMGAEVGADQVGEALDVPGLGVVLDVVKVVDMIHASKTPTTGQPGQPSKPGGTTLVFRP
ncbi:TrwB [Pandoraea cepalis]|uniref:TrwB n=1 Tax=Pandoraea cepalis TaxID=2508294 RepID=A0A5E4RJ64_9BURK|nr:type IV secretion system DNA-binding domain-containing protein [Pandoraea cepalis]VVD62069.1 TrwB [Pandoraea cepalis]